MVASIGDRLARWIFVIGDYVVQARDFVFEQMSVAPIHRDLQNPVQCRQRDAIWYQQAFPRQPLYALELDPQL